VEEVDWDQGFYRNRWIQNGLKGNCWGLGLWFKATLEMKTISCECISLLNVDPP